MSFKLGRRNFLSSLGAAGAAMLGAGKLNALTPTTGSMSSPGIPLVDGRSIVPITKGLGSTGNVWAELGIVPVVNTGGTLTLIGGSVMKPEVMELIRMGNEHFCVINDLEVASGKWLAKLVKAPEGMTALVTEGDGAALLVAYAGMMTEDYSERLLNIPDLRNFPRTEVIVQAGHRDPFDHQIRQTGAKLVVVETREEMIQAINPRTLAIHFLNIQSDRGQVNAPDTVAIAKQHGIYSFLDASADVPPKDRLWEFPAIGFDMTGFSGGKDICGPQATGFLIGHENLIHYALLNMSPQADRIGRPCKVSKESLFGLLKALELFVNQDYSETLRKYDAKADTITSVLKKYGVTMARTYNEAALGNVSPHYTWTWDPAKVTLTSADITKKLQETRPVAIGIPGVALAGRHEPGWTGPVDGSTLGASLAGIPDAPVIGGEGANRAGAGRRAAAPAARAGAPATGARAGRNGAGNSFGFSTWMLKDGEDRYVANRLQEIFAAAAIPGAVSTSSPKPAAKKP